MAIQNFLTEQINTVFDDCSSIKLYNDGKVKTFEKGSLEFEKIIQLWQITVNSGYEMPAFGVSIHELTMQSLQSGTHIEFVFDEVNYHNDMPFDSLLLSLQPNQYGYQLIRHYDDKYQGRCLYVNTTEINNDLYDYIESIINEKN